MAVGRLLFVLTVSLSYPLLTFVIRDVRSPTQFPVIFFTRINCSYTYFYWTHIYPILVNLQALQRTLFASVSKPVPLYLHVLVTIFLVGLSYGVSLTTSCIALVIEVAVSKTVFGADHMFLFTSAYYYYVTIHFVGICKRSSHGICNTPTGSVKGTGQTSVEQSERPSHHNSLVGFGHNRNWCRNFSLFSDRGQCLSRVHRRTQFLYLIFFTWLLSNRT